MPRETLEGLRAEELCVYSSHTPTIHLTTFMAHTPTYIHTHTPTIATLREKITEREKAVRGREREICSERDIYIHTPTPM